MYVRFRSYEQLFASLGFALPLTNFVKNKLAYIERQGWTEVGICYAASRSFSKLYELKRDNRFWSVFLNEVKKWAYKKGDPRWEEYNKRKQNTPTQLIAPKKANIKPEKPKKQDPVKQKEKKKKKDKSAERFTLRKANNKESVVYFIQSERGGPVKIGISTNVQGRLASLQTGFPYPLKVLATTPGGEGIEKGLHDIFAEHRLSGEWFKPEKELMDLITRLMNGEDEFFIINGASLAWGSEYPEVARTMR